MMLPNALRRALRYLPVAALLSLSAPLAAQSLDGAGLVPTGLLLRQMDGVKRVLMIGAHPDDEDTSFLTVMARSLGAETAYLALTRGDGGQDLIGPELWEGLGIIRTGELEAARRLDGGRQFFTRAFDYGYSKSAEEALRLWPREELLRDVVWVIRKFRPQVIVTVFSGTPRDGHGQHQAAGIMAREAFEAAGDPSRFPDQLERGVEAWTPDRLLGSSFRRFFGGEPDPSEIEIHTGVFDPLLGRSYFQLSMESRSQHRSQDMGTAQPLGPRETGVLPVSTHVEVEGKGVWVGVDTTLMGITRGLPGAAPARPHLEAYRSEVAAAREAFGLDPEDVAAPLTRALGHLYAARDAVGSLADTEFRTALGHKIELATRALMAASEVIVDVRSADDLLTPGEEVEVTVQLWNGGSMPLREVKTELGLPDGWTGMVKSTTGVEPDGSIAPDSLGVFTYIVGVPENAALSQMYYLRRPRDGALYRWPDESDLWGLPRDPAAVHATVAYAMEAGGSSVRLDRTRPWRYVGVDQARGEFEKPVLVVPALSVRVSPGGMAWPQGQTAARTVTVVVRSEADAGASGRVELRAPAGWSVEPAGHDFHLEGAGSERSVSFQIAQGSSVGAGEQIFRAVATTAEGRDFTEGYTLIDYEHITRTALYAPAESRVTVVPVAVTEGLRVGYIMGTGDDGPEAIRQMGAEVELLSDERVRDGDFSGFDVLVLGVRAYEARADVRAVNEQILDFARAGGTVVNQYNQYQFSRGGYAPYPLDISRPAARVADETAPVRILEPDAPVFTTPNRITQPDFDGWVQERGLYFPGSWDDAYTPLLEMHDPGEDARFGSLLVAPVGAGVYVHVSLSFFRQWAGRVPGAYRLFANLISLNAKTWSEFAGGR
jgi:LmbE family N-acetylglucosaminyl deacetylase